MSIETWLLIGSYLLTAVLGFLNFYKDFRKNKTEEGKEKGQMKLDEGEYIKSLNENIALANQRALQSDKEAAEFENRFDAKVKKLTDRIDTLEGKLNLALQENVTLKSEMAEMHLKQAMSQKLIDEQTIAQMVSQRLIEEQRREIIALQDFSERLIKEIVRVGGVLPEYKPAMFRLGEQPEE